MDQKKPVQVVTLPGRNELQYEMNGTILEFVLPELINYNMIGIMYHL